MKFGRSDYDELFKDIDSRIPEDEPVFLFRGTDPLVPRLLLNYATEMRLSGTDPQVADSVVAHAQRIMDWQKKHGAKHATLIHEDENTLRKKYRISEIISMIEVDGKLSDPVFDELSQLMAETYGETRFRLIMPDEVVGSSSENKWDEKYDLVLSCDKLKNLEILWMSRRMV